MIVLGILGIVVDCGGTGSALFRPRLPLPPSRPLKFEM